MNALTLEARRRAAQLAFIAGGAPLEVGSLAHFPLDLGALMALEDGTPPVELTLDSGLTARVYRLNVGGRRWTLKRARREPRVRNVDGRTSFLNEVQRRADLEGLKRQPGGERRWAGIVDTVYASFRDGLLLSPWIEGELVTHWDERRIGQLLALVCDLWFEGLFEWDLCPGNLLDDGRQVRLFDFGYLYRFDPRRQFSSAGHGTDVSLFHPAERFESRSFSAALLDLEQGHGAGAALALYRLEKEIALDTYRRLRARSAARGASHEVLAWLDGIAGRWALALGGDLASLYLAENWRSHVLDLHDDLSGQSCTPTTLRRADWLLAALDEHADALRAAQAFFGGDEHCDVAALRQRYQGYRRDAARHQIGAAPAEHEPGGGGWTGST